MSTVDLKTENFEETVLNNDIVLIDFWAPWCGPCKMFGPIFEKASEKHEGVVFAKINTDEEQEIAGQFQITSIPTLMVFREKIIVFAQPGMLKSEQLEDLISQVKALDMDDIRKKIEEEKNSN
ncbi:MAG: thioredoxin [Leptospiraceae bacterium]|nr:thioredoxin [Leptospiraceae bacterium]MCP5513474.1 thioredoxin [Leptospiraceae bacterium]